MGELILTFIVGCLHIHFTIYSRLLDFKKGLPNTCSTYFYLSNPLIFTSSCSFSKVEPLQKEAKAGH